MRFDALAQVRAGGQVGMLIHVGDAADIALDVLALDQAARRAAVVIADHVVLAGEDGVPHLRAGDDALDGVGRLARNALAAAADKAVAAVAGGGGVAERGAVARLAVVAAHGAQRHEDLRQVLCAVVAGRGEAVHHPDIVGLADGAGEVGDGLDRRTADVGSPGGVLHDAVVLALEVIAEVDVVLHVRSLGALGVEAHGVLLEEVPVNDVAFFSVQAQHFAGDAQQQRGIRTGADRHPLGVQRLSGSGEHRVDGDELRAVFLRAHIVRDRGARSGPRRVAGQEHEGIRVEHVVAVVVRAEAVAAHADGLMHVEQVGAVRGGVRNGGVAAEMHQRNILAVGAPGTGDERLVAVLFLDGDVLVGDVLDRLIPGNALPLVLAAHLAVRVLRRPALALHRILDTIRAEALLLLRLAAHAAALLRIINRVRVGIVSLLTNNDAILDEDLVHALAAAVMPAGSRNPLAALVVINNRGMHGLSQSALVRTGAHAQRRHSGGSSNAALEELPTIEFCAQQFVHQICHGSPPL